MVRNGRGEGISPSSVPPPSRQRHGQFSCMFMLSRLTHLQPPYPGPALLCCPGEVQSLLPVPEQVTSTDNSPALMTPGPALWTAIGGKGQGLQRASLPCSHCHTADKLWGQLSHAQGDSPALGHQCVVPVRCRASLWIAPA
jgi:hypothetical protein